MALTTKDQLRSAGRSLLEDMRKSASALSASSNLFLAHSSKDKGEVLEGAIKILSDHGAIVYADFLDPAAKALTPSQFGAFFSEAIHDTKRLVVLLTESTASSRWVPWELGLAHGVHKLPRVAVWPVLETGGSEYWASQEYLAVYPRVEWVQLKDTPQCQWAIRDPSDGRYWRLGQWLAL